MSLITTLERIVERLKKGEFPNEQAISQAVVQPVLRELDWDTGAPRSVFPEYGTGEGRVDFALCHPEAQPVIFIEVKQPGKADSGVKQALTYAFQEGGVMSVQHRDTENTE